MKSDATANGGWGAGWRNWVRRLEDRRAAPTKDALAGGECVAGLVITPKALTRARRLAESGQGTRRRVNKHVNQKLG